MSLDEHRGSPGKSSTSVPRNGKGTQTSLAPAPTSALNSKSSWIWGPDVTGQEASEIPQDWPSPAKAAQRADNTQVSLLVPFHLT